MNVGSRGILFLNAEAYFPEIKVENEQHNPNNKNIDPENSNLPAEIQKLTKKSEP